MKNVEEKNQKVVDFILENPKVYHEYLIKDRLQKIHYGYTSDVNQIYCYLGAVDVTETDYYEFYNLVKNNFDLNNKNIVEVACGYIPIIASIIKEEHTTSNVTAINRKIVVKNYKNTITEEYDLFNDYDFSSTDLIIGFRPCDVTEKIIRDAIKYKKDFCLYLCPCSLKPLNNAYKGKWTMKRWHNYIISLIKSTNEYWCQIIIDNKMMDECPIIIAKHK